MKRNQKMIAYVREDDENFADKLPTGPGYLIPTRRQKDESCTEQDLEHDEDDYNNPWFKIQDEIHAISMENLGFCNSMFY
jgi:hypothetical protein